MFKLNKVFLIVLALVLVWAVGVAPAFAQARYGTRTSQTIETTGIAIDDKGNAMDYPVYVYGISIFADAASSYMGVYDCDTLLELASASIYPKDEIGEATQYDTEERWYTTPKYFSDGVGVIMFTGVGFIHYGPEPTD